MIAFGSSQSQTITRLVGASPFQDSLWVFDTTNYNVVNRMGPTPSAGGAVTGTNGIARNPLTDEIFVIFKQSGTTGRLLAKFNPLNGVYTIVGNLGDNFSSITFASDGKLFGVTGDGATVPETLYRIDTATAAKTLVTALGNGADGEIICYNPTDNMLYHWSGSSPVVYEKVDTAGLLVTNIPIIGASSGETFGACYYGNNTFLISNIGSRFQIYSTDGTVGALIGSPSPDDIRGTALMTCPRIITGNPNYCIGSQTTLSAIDNSNSYQWYLNGVAIVGETSQTIDISTAGNYNCMVSDGCGTDTLSAGVVVQSYTLPVVALSGDTTFCTNDSTMLTGSSGGTSQWYFNGVLIPGATTNTYYAATPGLYNMTKTNLNGCTDSAAVGLTVYQLPNPIVSATSFPSNGIVCAGAEVTLFGSGANTYSWTGGVTDGISFTPDSSLMYVVTGTDTNQCSDTASVSISVIDCTGLNNLQAEAKFELFPNPASDIINIVSDSPLKTIVVYNAFGEIVLMNSTQELNATIDISGFKPGLYVVKTEIGMQKFVKQ